MKTLTAWREQLERGKIGTDHLFIQQFLSRMLGTAGGGVAALMGGKLEGT